MFNNSDKSKNNNIFNFLIYNTTILLLFVGYYWFDILICKSFIYWLVIFQLLMHVFFIGLSIFAIVSGKLLKNSRFIRLELNIDELRKNQYSDIILLILTAIIEFSVLWYFDYFTLAYILVGVFSTTILLSDFLLRMFSPKN